MKSEIWFIGLAGILWYLYSSKSSTNVPSPYPFPSPGRKPTGSGGVTAGSGSVNPLPGGTVAQGGSVPTGSGGVVAQGSYYTCPDGTLTNDMTLCASGSGYVTCPDGTMVNDYSLCPSTPMDTMDPCDPTSIAYDPSICGSPATDFGSIGGDYVGADGGSSGGDGIADADSLMAY